MAASSAAWLVASRRRLSSVRSAISSRTLGIRRAVIASLSSLTCSDICSPIVSCSACTFPSSAWRAVTHAHSSRSTIASHHIMATSSPLSAWLTIVATQLLTHRMRGVASSSVCICANAERWWSVSGHDRTVSKAVERLGVAWPSSPPAPSCIGAASAPPCCPGRGSAASATKSSSYTPTAASSLARRCQNVSSGHPWLCAPPLGDDF